jgi:hypothetical protein
MRPNELNALVKKLSDRSKREQEQKAKHQADKKKRFLTPSEISKGL